MIDADSGLPRGSLECLAGVWAAEGDSARAARLLGAAEVLREAIQVPVETTDLADYERFRALARAGLEETAFASAWEQGRATTPERAIAEAVSTRGDPPSV